jgi:nucleoside-diphosphate-sugar epimerase
MPTVLVTGAAGGVGRSVCRVLAQAGFAVRGLVRPEDDCNRVPLPRQQVTVGYVQDADVVGAGLRGADAVVNCAALLPAAVHLGPLAFQQVNVQGPLNVLEQAARAGVRRAVFFSTISVVDHVGGKVTPETLYDYLPPPHDPYLASKIASEKALRAASAWFDGQVTILRPAFIYGPGNYAVWEEGLRLLRQGKMKLVGDGTAPLPLIYAEDIARFIAFLLRRPAGVAGYDLHVLANPEPTTLADVFNFLADHLGVARPGRVSFGLLRLATEVVRWLPPPLRLGRLKLLTRARLAQYSRGYDLSGTHSSLFLDNVPLTGYRDGLQAMLADYLGRRAERQAA